mmetsp:Transcript_39724/g.64437  ORF Transcript_39724/g.64437 Transcript_39724/m.64437 type:complete len:203 (+) Transcript_39724:2180-2788(+)
MALRVKLSFSFSFRLCFFFPFFCMRSCNESIARSRTATRSSISPLLLQARLLSHSSRGCNSTNTDAGGVRVQSGLPITLRFSTGLNSFSESMSSADRTDAFSCCSSSTTLLLSTSNSCSNVSALLSVLRCACTSAWYFSSMSGSTDNDGLRADDCSFLERLSSSLERRSSSSRYFDLSCTRLRAVCRSCFSFPNNINLFRSF